MAKISFCGISGSGMSAIAQVLKFSGHEIQGTDRNFDLGKDIKNKKALEDIGIKIYPQDGSAIDDSIDYICASTAVENDIPDIKVAKEKGVNIKTRPEVLTDIFHSYKYGIAVGGTSGKTTTTAMIGYILDKAGKKPCVINGGLLRDYENSFGIPNVILNKGNICVIEADESNGSISLYNPYISVINNISEDHKSLSELFALFQQFSNRTTNAVIINDDYEVCRKIQHNNKCTFSIKNPHADFFAYNIKPLPNGTQYSFRNQTYTLNLIGAFNVANALAALAVCEKIGVDAHVAAKILSEFHGTKRRLEIIGSKKNITIIDDFAHNPDKIKASVSSLRQYQGRLIILFQPHGFGPMRSLGKEIIKEFVSNMAPDDILVMPEIFFVGGTVTKDISSADLISYAHSLGKKNAFFFAERTQAENFILSLAKSGDRIVIMGARDNSLTDLCYDFLQRIAA